MSEHEVWRDQLHALLTGALAVWRVEGRVVKDDRGAVACTVRTADAAVRIERHADAADAPFWEVAASDSDLPPLPFAGIQGMLRAVRELLAPDRSASRLVVGPQPGEG